MGVGISDAAFELVGACVHSLRFAFGAPLEYPYAPLLADGSGQPPAIFRRLQAVSPPPSRDGEPWYTGMTLAGEPFLPDIVTGADRLAAVQHVDGIPSLDVADPETVVLDEWITVDRCEKPRPMAFPGPDRGSFLLSIGYWSPIPEGEKSAEKMVRYYGEYRLNWARVPEGRWVAVSLDAFWPPERDSGDVIIPLGECDSSCPV
ncbi:hypothetical protein JIG36_08545 [Actinoplanes sp. LDG1-06]|uniref:Uncharacterized protein n=1 Tax=Paractinoplanes ovalisporus TaxID=2810368 RepID=A0ABS2A6Z4_9ACTN|nr:hypothetical protein [Actinoplanes ovalisporus]MBM2615612.1 hypothetical protein [Actinoplanes ovalisporus]